MFCKHTEWFFKPSKTGFVTITVFTLHVR